MSKYLKQLSLDLPRWVGLGYVTEPNAALITADAQAHQKEGWFRLPLILSMLGGLLVFAGVISWVAGNWNDIPRLTRVVMLISGMLGSFIAAHYLREKGSDGLAQGFAFLGALMFGADIMLIAQIYQLPSNPPGGALLWTLGAAVVAIFWPSQLCMALAFALAGIWTWFASALNTHDIFWELFFTSQRSMHFPFLVLWGALAAYSVKRDWTKALHMAGLVLCFWVGHSLFAIFDDFAPRYAGLVLAIMLLALTVAGHLLAVARPGVGIVSKYIWVMYGWWLLFATAPDFYRILGYSRDHITLPAPLIIGLLVLGVAGMVSERLRPAAIALAMSAAVLMLFNMVVLSALALAMAVAAIVHGYKNNEKFFVNAGFTLFAFKVMWIYFGNDWGLRGNAAFFITGGLLIVALGIVFDRQRRKLILKMQEAN